MLPFHRFSFHSIFWFVFRLISTWCFCKSMPRIPLILTWQWNLPNGTSLFKISCGNNSCPFLWYAARSYLKMCCFYNDQELVCFCNSAIIQTVFLWICTLTYRIRAHFRIMQQTSMAKMSIILLMGTSMSRGVIPHQVPTSRDPVKQQPSWKSVRLRASSRWNNTGSFLIPRSFLAHRLLENIEM